MVLVCVVVVCGCCRDGISGNGWWLVVVVGMVLVCVVVVSGCCREGISVCG